MPILLDISDRSHRYSIRADTYCELLQCLYRRIHERTSPTPDTPGTVGQRTPSADRQDSRRQRLRARVTFSDGSRSLSLTAESYRYLALQLWEALHSRNPIFLGDLAGRTREMRRRCSSPDASMTSSSSDSPSPRDIRRERSGCRCRRGQCECEPYVVSRSELRWERRNRWETRNMDLMLHPSGESDFFNYDEGDLAGTEEGAISESTSSEEPSSEDESGIRDATER